jgi:hypothetical protein
MEALGPPNLKIQGFQIWIHGRQYPNNHDYWDGNWLRVTAHCGGNGASVFATGSIIHLTDLMNWFDQLEKLSIALKGEAKLGCIEPYIAVDLKFTTLGHIKMEVSITPDLLSQRHWFEFDIDQSFLDPFIRQCRSVLTEYPLRGDRESPHSKNDK